MRRYFNSFEESYTDTMNFAAIEEEYMRAIDTLVYIYESVEDEPKKKSKLKKILLGSLAGLGLLGAGAGIYKYNTDDKFREQTKNLFTFGKHKENNSDKDAKMPDTDKESAEEMEQEIAQAVDEANKGIARVRKMYNQGRISTDELNAAESYYDEVMKNLPGSSSKKTTRHPAPGTPAHFRDLESRVFKDDPAEGIMHMSKSLGY